jgi:hypothetical protein
VNPPRQRSRDIVGLCRHRSVLRRDHAGLHHLQSGVAWRRIVHANRQHDQEIDDMSPLFGHKDRQAAKDTDEQMNATLQAELDRLGSLSIEDLAAEVMVKGFGPGGPGQDDDHVTVGRQNANSGPDVYDIAHGFVDYGGTYLYGTPLPLEILWRGILKLVAEGLQELEHAC